MAASRALPRLPRNLYYGWMIVAVCFAGNVAAGSMHPVFVAFFLQPMSDDFGWGRSTLAWGITFRTGVGSVASIILGPVVDRHGTRWLGAITCAVAGVSVMGLCFVQELWQVYLLFAISGITGFGVPAGSHLSIVPVVKWFVAGRAKALAMVTSGMALGVFLAIPSGSFLIEEIGWRQTWLASGILVLVVLVPGYAIFMRREPEDHGLEPDGARQASPGQPLHAPLVEEVQWTLRQALRTKALWAVMLSQAAIQFALVGLSFHRVPFWQDQGLSSNMVAWGIATDPLVAVFSILIVGFVCHRISVQRLGFIGAVGWALSVTPMLFYQDGHDYLIFVQSSGWALAAGASLTFTNLVWPAFFGRRAVGTIRGAVLPVAVASSALAPPLYGYIIDATSYSAAISLSAAVFVAGGTVYLFSRAPKRRPTILAAEPEVVPTA